MKLSCSAYQAGSSYAQKILSGHTQNYGATSSTTSTNVTGDSSHGITMPTWTVEEIEGKGSPNETEFGAESSSYQQGGHGESGGGGGSGRGEFSRRTSSSLSHHSDLHPDHKGQHSDSTSISKAPATSSCSPSDSPAHRSKSNQRWMKLRTTVQLSGAIQTIQKKAPLKREDSFLKRFSTRQIPEAQETFELGDEDGTGAGGNEWSRKGRKKRRSLPRSVVNPDGNFYFYWLMLLTFCVLYNLWTLIVRQSFPELQAEARLFWILADAFSDLVFLLDIAVQFRTGYLEQGLMVWQTKKLAKHYIGSKPFYLDLCSLVPTDLFQLYFGINPMFRFPRFLKIYRIYNYYYMVESRTVYPNVWRVVNLIHILLLLAHWFGCFYYLISEAEKFEGHWGYPHPEKYPDFAPLTRKYLGSLYWSTLTLTTIGDLPPPHSNWQYLFTIVSYLIGVFIFATIVGQVGNVITNRNANRLEFERLLDGAKMYMRHHKVPRDMQRRVLRWYDYSWSRGRIQGGGDINTALGLLPDKLKTELALHVNLSVLKKVTIFQECQPEFLHDLVLKMKAYIFTPGDLICRKGEVAREMFIIADGILEVISETGRVLTTMQAGDFFGEIGILNLDGLNKRTADVRSVGYSELFSLSREDVLAAMKDYPEAQEILQTLGRKRLMEARKASGPATKKITIGAVGTEAKKTSPVHVGLSRSQSSHSNKELPDGSTSTGAPVDSNAGKRIVEKLRSDVKGLRNAIRRSRKSNSSKEDSSEPESGKADVEAGGSKGRKASIRDTNSFPPPRGVLKRMHNVLSDEKDKDPSTSPSTSTPSPAPKMKVGGFASTVKRMQQPKKTVAPPPEPEIIGAGLPLIQRLRLLKQKEDRERKQTEEREAMMKTLIPTNLSLASPTVSPIRQTQASVEPPPAIKTMDPATALANVVERARVERASISSNDSGSTISSPPTTHPYLGTFSPKSNLLIGEAAAVAVSKVTAEPIPMGSSGSFPPLWTASPPRGPGPSGDIVTYSSIPPQQMGSDRPSALHFRHQHTSKNYGSVDDLSPEFSRLPFIKKLKILNERQKIAELLLSKSANSVLTRSTSEGSNENPSVPVDFFLDTSLYSVQMGRRTQSNKEQLQIDDEDGASISQYFSQQATPLSDCSARIEGGSSGMESKSKKRSESSTAVKVKASQDSNTTICLKKDDSSPSTSAPATGKAKVRKRRNASKIPHDDGNEGSTEDSSPSPPLSPEGETNETPERRNLKSILKKLAETGSALDGRDQETTDDKQLLKSHTVEGYAARHRKFAKNVTFRRQAVTVVSPQGPPPPITASEPSQGAVDGHPPAVQPRVGVDRLLGDESNTATGLPFPTSIPLTRPLSPENMKTLSSLLMVKGDEMVLTLGEEDRSQFQGLNVAQEECIGSVVLGIKTIIQAKMDEIQCKFQNRFESLEHEVRHRDDIISILQERIEELENRDFKSEGGRRIIRNAKTLQLNHIDANLEAESDTIIDGDMDDDDEDAEFRSNRLLPQMQSSYLFSRGDSIDTVISAQDYDDEVFERTDLEFREAREALSQQVQSTVHPTNHQNPQQFRRNTTDSNGRQNYVASWAQEQDTIEMRDLGLAPWQLEFHRDRDALPPPNGSRDAVAVEIGNTSTEYESSSSEDGGLEHPLAGGVQLQEQKVPLDDDDYEELEVEESDDSDQSEKSSDLNNKNWEVLLLAKEMDKQEEKRRTTEEVVGEMRELENEIEEMKDVVNTGSLSPSELDMLESILESKSKRMKALYKALSVESGSAAAAAHKSTCEPMSPKSKVGRSHDDFRRSSAGPTNFPQSLTPAGLGQPTLHPRSALNLGIFSRSSSTAEKGSRLSPGEKLDLQRLIFSHKGRGVKRQASLCEPSQSSSSSYDKERRRESAGSIPFPQPGDRGARKSSFLSRFSLMRQFTSIGRHGTHQPVPESSLEPETPPLPTIKPPEERAGFDSYNLSRQTSSSVGILPMISSTIASALSSSVKSDPGQSTAGSSETVTISGTTTIVVVNTTTSTTGGTLTTPSHPGVFTIPSISFPSASTGPPPPHSSSDSKQLTGESQPLLKK